MHPKAFQLSGNIEVLADGKPLANGNGKLYRICATQVDSPARTYHVIYELTDAEAAKSYLQDNLPHISEQGKQTKEGWYVSPEMPLASSSPQISEMLSKLRASLVIWQKDNLVHKLFCSERAASLKADDLAAAQERAVARCKETLQTE